jgi:hypothetical protein
VQYALAQNPTQLVCLLNVALCRVRDPLGRETNIVIRIRSLRRLHPHSAASANASELTIKSPIFLLDQLRKGVFLGLDLVGADDIALTCG